MATYMVTVKYHNTQDTVNNNHKYLKIMKLILTDLQFRSVIAWV